ncbi:MAG: hypothetical protein ABW199_12555, partial [Caulobacterales bacterium]
MSAKDSTMKNTIRAAFAAALAAGLCAAPALAENLRTNARGTFGEVRLQTGFSPDPHTISVNAGGTIDASSAVGGNCTGMIAARPDFTVRYTAGSLPLYISSTSDSDTTLVVRAPNGTFTCDDDSAGALDPVVHFQTPQSGKYQIWVGRFGTGATDTPRATLGISEIGAQSDDDTASDETQRPDASLTPAYGVLALSAGFNNDPRTVSIQAGGSYNATGLGVAGCTGFIARAPDYRVNYTAGSLPLIFSVAANSDTTLVINGPNGQWQCDDDSGNAGLNPMVRFDQPASGQYDVWVGTYASGATQASTLHISELT